MIMLIPKSYCSTGSVDSTGKQVVIFYHCDNGEGQVKTIYPRIALVKVGGYTSIFVRLYHKMEQF